MLKQGARRFKPLTLTPKRQAHEGSISISPLETAAARVTLNAAIQAGACGGAMWQSEAPLSPAPGPCLSGGRALSRAPV
jgi:hypothetical protein